MRLFAIAPHNSLRSDNAPQPQLACMKYTEASLSSVNGAYFPSRQNEYKLVIVSEYLKILLLRKNNISSAFPQPGRPRPTAVAGRENSPGRGGTTKMIRKMREEELEKLIVYIL